MSTDAGLRLSAPARRCLDRHLGQTHLQHNRLTWRALRFARLARRQNWSARGSFELRLVSARSAWCSGAPFTVDSSPCCLHSQRGHLDRAGLIQVPLCSTSGWRKGSCFGAGRPATCSPERLDTNACGDIKCSQIWSLPLSYAGHGLGTSCHHSCDRRTPGQECGSHCSGYTCVHCTTPT